MVRYSPEHKAENHETILSMAARSFREHGGDSSGNGEVMKKAGLTKGGFYRNPGRDGSGARSSGSIRDRGSYRSFQLSQNSQNRYAVGRAFNGAIRQPGGVLGVALAWFLWVRIRSAPQRRFLRPGLLPSLAVPQTPELAFQL